MTTPLNRQAWLLPLLLLAVLIGVAAVRWWQPATNTDVVHGVPATKSDAPPILLEIDTDEGTPLTRKAPWQPNMTVLDALGFADDLAYSVNGRGAAAFLTELAGYPNEGPGGRNWQFEVNGKWSNRGLGVHELQPGDRVLWKLQSSE